MCVKLVILRHHLLEFRVAEAPFDAHHDCLRHFVGDNLAGAFFAMGPRDIRFWHRQNKLSSFMAQDRHLSFQTSDFPAQIAETGRFFQLAAGLLQSEVEKFLAQIAALGGKLRGRHIFKL